MKSMCPHYDDPLLLLGNSTVHTVSTVGAIDMGGASLQLAFEIPQSVSHTFLST